jgi:hypothetical protein
LATVRAALADLDAHRVKWRLEGLVWHQGENDMFDDAARKAYADNLTRFLACWRRDLQAPELRCYVGELCTKTIWGMDNRMPMYGIAAAQQRVAAADPRVRYVRTNHVAVKVGQPEGLHYHYGTLGQLEHGIEHARAYLADQGIAEAPAPTLRTWPYAAGKEVALYVLTGHRNMEGERAFTAQLADVPNGKALMKPRADVAFRYSTGGGVHTSGDWQPLAPVGRYDTFGPELAFARALTQAHVAPFALAKFTHSGSQTVDWTPAGSEAATRNLFAPFVAFVREALADLQRRGQPARLAGIVHHVGENDLAYGPYRREVGKGVAALIAGVRQQLALPELRWFVSVQHASDHEGVQAIDVVRELRTLAEADPHLRVVEVGAPPTAQPHAVVFDAAATVWLGSTLAAAVVAAGR